MPAFNAAFRQNQVTEMHGKSLTTATTLKAADLGGGVTHSIASAVALTLPSAATCMNGTSYITGISGATLVASGGFGGSGAGFDTHTFSSTNSLAVVVLPDVDKDNWMMVGNQNLA